MYRSRKDRGLLVVGVGFEWGFPFTCAEWADAFQLSFPIIDDTAYKIVNFLEIPNVPFTIIIDQNRVVQHANYGFDELVIVNKIDNLLRVAGTLSTESVFSDLDSMQPGSIFLASPYPNPFNPTTTISYSLQQAGVVRLEAVDLQGHMVANLMQGWQASGNHKIIWDARNLASGAYIIRLISNGVIDSRKVILSK